MRTDTGTQLTESQGVVCETFFNNIEKLLQSGSEMLCIVVALAHVPADTLSTSTCTATLSRCPFLFTVGVLSHQSAGKWTLISCLAQSAQFC